MADEQLEPANGDPAQSRLTRVELALVLLVTLLGLGLRAALPSRMAVEHFDEGVYASNFFFSGEKGDEHYPDQHLYAPPLVPLLIELALLAGGKSNAAAMAPGIVTGTLTIPLLWWVGRRWFSPTAGLFASTLLALSDVHIVFSRTALTDVVLCFFLLAAVHCFWVAQTTSNRLALFASGALTGLAWWTKYNGWLPLAIGLAGALAWKIVGLWTAMRPGPAPRLVDGPQIRSLIRTLAIWLAVAVIALCVWGPWLWALQGKGGYAAVAANHRGYLVGFADWGSSFTAQARKLSLLSGPLTGLSPLLGLALALRRLRATGQRFTWNGLLRNDAIYFVVPVLGLLCVVEGSGVILAFLGIVGTVIGMDRATSIDARSSLTAQRGSLAGWMLTAWVAGLLVSVPLYSPYPRLVLPLLVACWLGAGLLADVVVDEILRSGSTRGSDQTMEPLLNRMRPGRAALAGVKPVVLLVLGIGIAVAAFQRPLWEQKMVAWQSRDGLANIAPELRDDVARLVGVSPKSDPDQFVIYTYSEPALLFQLRRAGCIYVKPVKDVAFANPEAPPPRLSSVIAFGPQAWGTPGFGKQLAQALPRLQLIGKYRYFPSDVVLLDGNVRHHRRPEYEIEAYLVK